MSVKVIKDTHGTLHRISATPEFVTKVGIKFEAKPGVDIWWDRGAHIYDEDLIMRQENADGEKADVIILSQGQAHDMLKAIAGALNKP